MTESEFVAETERIHALVIERLSPGLARRREAVNRAEVAAADPEFLKPDWGTLSSGSVLELQQAVALLSCINPTFAWVLGEGVVGLGEAREVLATAAPRLRLAASRLGLPPNGQVTLSEVAALACNVGWPLPPGFPGTCGPTQLDSATNASQAGHEVGNSSNAAPGTQRKLTPAQEEEVIRCLGQGQSVSSIAKKFNVSRATIDKYRAGGSRGAEGGRPGPSASDPFGQTKPQKRRK